MLMISKKRWLFETLWRRGWCGEETDEFSKAAGVKSNGSWVGDIGCSEGVIDLNDVDDDVDENHDDRDDNV